MIRDEVSRLLQLEDSGKFNEEFGDGMMTPMELGEEIAYSRSVNQVAFLITEHWSMQMSL